MMSPQKNVTNKGRRRLKFTRNRSWLRILDANSCPSTSTEAGSEPIPMNKDLHDLIFSTNLFSINVMIQKVIRRGKGAQSGGFLGKLRCMFREGHVSCSSRQRVAPLVSVS